MLLRGAKARGTLFVSGGLLNKTYLILIVSVLLHQSIDDVVHIQSVLCAIRKCTSCPRISYKNTYKLSENVVRPAAPALANGANM